MAAMSNAELDKFLGILKGVKLDESVDYATIGKTIVASILHQNEEKMRSERPDSQGHIRLESNLNHSIKVHTDPSIEVCCICTVEGGIIICRGKCC